MAHTRKSSHWRILSLTLGALGVVYGDIGTSPLYAMREIFFGHNLWHEPTKAVALELTSTVFWALTLVITLKYVILVLRADNEGDGGVFALYGLLERLKKHRYVWLLTLLIIAAGLLFGDGIITPAISVMSAVEGLAVITSTFQPFVIPITIAILIALFAIQPLGTKAVGRLFGPIMLLWFLAIGGIGLRAIVLHPFTSFALPAKELLIHAVIDWQLSL